MQDFIFVVTLINVMNVPYEADAILSDEKWAFTSIELAEAFAATKQLGIAPENMWISAKNGDSYLNYSNDNQGDSYAWECFIRKLPLNPSA